MDLFKRDAFRVKRGSVLVPPIVNPLDDYRSLCFLNARGLLLWRAQIPFRSTLYAVNGFHYKKTVARGRSPPFSS